MENTILGVEEIAKEQDYRDYLAPKWKRLVNFLFDYYFILIVWFAGIIVITSYMDQQRDVVPDYLFNFLIIFPFISVALLYFF